MKIAIIGSEGRLGIEISKQFKTATKFNHKILDITKKEQILKKLKGFDLVINSAAYTYVDKSEQEKKLCYDINTKAVRFLAQAARKYNFTLLQISTDYVFNGKKKKGYNENDRPDPINYYGQTKLEAEKIVRKLKKHYIIRTQYLFGKSPTCFVNKIVNSKLKELKVVDDQICAPTYVVDLAKAIKKIISENKEYGTYHITNSNPISLYEFTKLIFKIKKQNRKIIPIKLKDYKTIAKRPKNTILLNNKTKPLPTVKNALERFLK